MIPTSKLLTATLCSFFVCCLAGALESPGQTISKEAFTPVQVGDVWQYKHERREWPFGEDQHEPVTLGYRHFAVSRDTVVSGESYFVIRRKIYDQDQHFVTADSCLVQVDSANKVIYPEIEPGCSRFDLWNDFYGSLPPRLTNGETVYQTIEHGGEIAVGGTIYATDALALSTSSDGHAAGWLLHYAVNIGLYKWVYEYPPEPYGPIDGHVLSHTLVYADVGDVVYGARVVSVDEPHAAPVDQVVLSTFPNPFDDLVWLEITGPVGQASIEIFNILGRRVQHRDISISKNMSRVGLRMEEFSPGPYILRITSHDGRVTTRPFIKGR